VSVSVNAHAVKRLTLLAVSLPVQEGFKRSAISIVCLNMLIQRGRKVMRNNGKKTKRSWLRERSHSKQTLTGHEKLKRQLISMCESETEADFALAAINRMSEKGTPRTIEVLEHANSSGLTPLISGQAVINAILSLVAISLSIVFVLYLSWVLPEWIG